MLAGHVLFFASNRPGGCGSLDIYVSFRRSVRDDFGWEALVNLGCEVNWTANNVTPSYFDDDTGIIPLHFHSNRSGGLAGTDTYASTMKDAGTFGPAVVLARELSAEFDDQRPNIQRNGLEIFLESNRTGTLGSSDLWASRRASTRER